MEDSDQVIVPLQATKRTPPIAACTTGGPVDPRVELAVMVRANRVDAIPASRATGKVLEAAC